jgi:heat shock protein HslJ/uncharacterized membrane protein
MGLFLLAVLMNCTTSVASPPHPATAIVYFKANGTQPVWHLEIAEDEIQFNSSTPGFERVIMPHAEPVRSENGQIKTYKLKTREAEMEIEVTDMLCQNPNSRERFPFSVNVNIKRKGEHTPTVFSGCGLYVPDSRLQGRWRIETVKSVAVPDTAFKSQPLILELAVDGSYFTCFSGCNTISGRLFFERTLLRFTDLVIPKEKCDQMEMEKNIISALQFTTQYAVTRDDLTLGNPSMTLLTMHKAK